MSQRTEDLKEIKRIISEKDDNAVEESVFGFILKYARDEDILLLLCKIFESDWHTRQEDLASSFQYIKNPITAKSLFKMSYQLTEYDKLNDTFPMQRKCTWALADIGTKESKRYLQEIERTSNKTISSFATKRIVNWENELSRKGQMLRSDKNHRFQILLENYTSSLNELPNDGQRIIGYEQNISTYKVENFNTGKLSPILNEYVVVYQAFKKSIANFAIENQTLGGSDFSYNRMSWIKPNFLWMMHRCGWAEKVNQERVLAIWIKKEAFEEILQNSTFTTFKRVFFETEQKWRDELETKKVRLQWDPDHDLFGEKLERKAIQLGLKDEVLEKFGKEQIECIMDITDFVKEQKILVDKNQLDKVLIPKERIVKFDNQKLLNKIENNK